MIKNGWKRSFLCHAELSCVRYWMLIVALHKLVCQDLPMRVKRNEELDMAEI